MNPTVFKLGIISFFADVSSEMLYPIAPIFLTSVLGASMASVGLIEGLADGISNILRIYSGVWSDRLRMRKPFIIVGYFFATIAKPITGMATVWTHVLAARSLDRVGKGLRTAPRDAMLSESVPFAQRGHAFGIHRAMDTLGAALGPLFTILLLGWFQGDLRKIYWVAFFPGILAVGLVFFLRESPHPKTLSEPMVWTWKKLPKSFKQYARAWAVFCLANSSDVFLIMRVKESTQNINTAIVLYVFYNLVYAALSPFFGKWSDRIPRRKVMLIGIVIFSLVYFGFAFATHLWQFWILFGFYGIYMAATEGVGKALAVDLFDPEWKATAIGIIGAVTGFSTMIASITVGLIWDHWGATTAFIYTGVGALLAAILLNRVKEGRIS